MANSFNLDHRRAALQRALAGLPLTIGTLAVNFSKERFRAGGWYDTTFQPWAKRSDKAKRNKGRAILVDTGRLRRSIRISKLGRDSVTIGTDVPYARMHNDGLTGTVRVRAHERSRFKRTRVGTGKPTKSGKERKQTVQTLTGTHQVAAHDRKVDMPQRRFLGESQYLNRIIERKINSEIQKVFR